MNEKEKLIQLIKAAHEKASDFFHKEAMAILKQGKSYNSKDRTKTFDEFVADALIENGIGDIAEWKARAEIVERELEKYKRALKNITFKYAKKNGYVLEITIPYLLQQAEKEIEEDKQQ